MVAVQLFNDETVVVLGLGKTGLAAAHALAAGGAHVIAWDDHPDKRRLPNTAQMTILDPMLCHWNDIHALILSPGIAHTFPVPHPIVVKAKQHRIPIYSDIDLYLKSHPKVVKIGVTGTNGKSTTTALIEHILRWNDKPTVMGGNIGNPVLSLEDKGDHSITVLELSSYQLEISKIHAYDVAILLNISPDHLARHGGFENYIKAKQLIFKNQHIGQRAIIGIDDPHCEKIYQSLQTYSYAQVIPISAKSVVKGGVSIIDGTLFDTSMHGQEKMLDLSEVPHIYSYHGQNVAAAYATAKHFGISREGFIAALSSFRNLPHRQELVAVIDHVRYINDSKATNPDAAAQALKAYEDIFWIVGGRPKDAPLDALLPYMRAVQHAFLIGEAQTRFAPILEQHVSVTQVSTMEEAVEMARSFALASRLKEPVVLLSPACESFDLYRNFEERGEHFKSLVHKLPGLHIQQKEKD